MKALTHIHASREEHFVDALKYALISNPVLTEKQKKAQAKLKEQWNLMFEDEPIQEVRIDQLTEMGNRGFKVPDEGVMFEAYEPLPDSSRVYKKFQEVMISEAMEAIHNNMSYLPLKCRIWQWIRMRYHRVIYTIRQVRYIRWRKKV
jgi:hypothetical protein